MGDVWVVNASPIIVLDRIGRLGLLSRLGADIVIPGGVIAEVTCGPKAADLSSLGGHREIDVTAWHPLVAGWDLGRGESEVLTLAASAPGMVAVVDDRAARSCAKVLGIATIGTLRVLVRAKERGLMSSMAAEVESLRRAGMFLSEGVVAAALKLAKEET